MENNNKKLAKVFIKQETKMKKLFIIVVALSAFYATVAEDVPCETVDIFELNWAGIMSPKTCSFNSSVSVQSDGYQISNRFIPDPTVEGLRLANKGICSICRIMSLKSSGISCGMMPRIVRS